MDDLIEQLYDAFPVNKRLPKHLDVCTQDVSDNEHKFLRFTDRREVSASLIFCYNVSVKSGHFESAALEFKHFLPRIIQLYVQGEEIHWETELSFCRFSILKETDWGKNEIKILQHFAYQFLSSLTCANELISGLIALNSLPINPSVLLNDWAEDISISKLECFSDILEDEFNWDTRKLNNCFADETLNQVFDQWLHSPQVISKITKACEKHLLDNQWDPELDALYDYLIELGKRANP